MTLAHQLNTSAPILFLNGMLIVGFLVTLVHHLTRIETRRRGNVLWFVLLSLMTGALLGILVSASRSNSPPPPSPSAGVVGKPPNP